MKKILGLLFLFLLLGGCSSKPTPGWIVAGNQQLETFKQQFLTGGQPIVTERHFRKAIEEIKKSGDLDLLGKAWLTKMALEVAVLRDMEEEDYLKVSAALPVPANRNFYLFLKGEKAAVDRSLLPAQYRRFLDALRSGSLVEAERMITAMEDDPLSRLIAAGIAVRFNLESEAVLKVAVETASRNGWKRALLAWLERLLTFYKATGDAAKAAAIRQRIDLMK
jgi:hypothetical protein